MGGSRRTTTNDAAVRLWWLAGACFLLLRASVSEGLVVPHVRSVPGSGAVSGRLHPSGGPFGGCSGGRSAAAVRSRHPAKTTDDETETALASSSSSGIGGVFSDSVRQEAKDALEAAGWASPGDADAELTSDDPFVRQIDAGIQRDYGFGLDDLLNPAKVVNLERELYGLRSELAALTGGTAAEGGGGPRSTEECDGGGGGDEADAVRAKIAKKESDLAVERRSVFRDWLKNVFVGQAVISFGVSYVMATNPKVLFGGFDWFYSYNMDISIQVLGYWFWWLFIVPSLRSRRPKGAEKRALDIAFLATPLVSILAPVATKDTGLIWAANFAVVAAAYGVAFLTDDGDDDGNDDDADSTSKRQPAWLKFVYKSLDFGSGRERGARN